MSAKNTENSFGNIAKAFHWVMFLVITGLIIVGLVMGDLPDATPEEAQFKFDVMYDQHKSFGLLALLLVVLRLAWRMINPVPKMPDTMSKIENMSAHGMHVLLYIIMFVMPISGWLMSMYGGHDVAFFGIPLPMLVDKDKAMGGIAHEIHEVVGLGMIFVILVHVAAALYHHFVKKDDILLRMSPHSKN